ncbi:23S rRNA pseudouridine(1911/1915/1917) synthase RluD [Chitinimonas koreensis]|uniref:23S rRNA pseudouridine(1911/1915/1917) synthase RluD n=1 Tax=Chitinimonas koreensis TaxID=356302 RepID=UPI000A00026F|nr:23S rRNA pseudouridine(1911/1915/1917) synthase RluD [Chitinimonas koreensis]QNM95814.1 23S rRNA pseudouridine(1911/1915/1917) synthase RluD [Chitinimonas koreensis]
MEHSDIEADDYSESDATLRVSVPTDCAGGRLDAVLAKLMPDYSRSRLARWIEQGKARLDGKAASPKTRVWGGETVEVDAEPDPETQAFQPEPVEFPVIHEDAALVVIDKPAGLVVHPAAGNWSGTLLNGLLHRYPELAGVPRAGIVHRLDKDTSGLMVVARTLKAQTELVRQLQARSVKRHYLAVAQGVLAADGTVDAPIGRHPRDRLRMAVVPNGKPAVTHFGVLERYARHTLVECRLETGRTHQIRVHMAHIGHPLAADPVYGGRALPVSDEVAAALAGLRRQALHAARLALVHPDSGETLQWSSPPSVDFAALVDALRHESA